VLSKTGRFINADDTEYIDFTETVIGTNIFTYCENSPIIHADYNGNCIHLDIGALVGGLMVILGYFVEGFADAILSNKKFNFNFFQ
jgi:hypothetical protein